MIILLKNACYFMYSYYCKKHFNHERAKITSVLFLGISIFLYLNSMVLFVNEFVSLEHPYKALYRVVMGLLAIGIYVWIYFLFEKESKFQELVKLFELRKIQIMRKRYVMLYLFGSLFSLLLSIICIGILRNSVK
jgi:hypothetical protein